MTEGTPASFEGGCDYRGVRYRMTNTPLFVHCCHCRWCARCSACRIALWSNYAGAGDKVRFVRVGALDDRNKYWPPRSLERRRALFGT